MLLRRVVHHLLLGCAFAWLAVSGPAIASEYHGQVTFSGLPVPGTTVTVTATQGGKTVAAVTDDQGIYSFHDLADGTWTIQIEMTGFAPLKQDVTVAPNAPAGAFELKLMSLDQIRAAAKPIKVDAAAVATASTTPAATTPAATPGKATPAKGAANTQAASAATPNAPAPAPEPASTQASNDGFLINGSVNNAATSQFSMNQAFGNNRTNGRSLYNRQVWLILDNSWLDAKPYSLAGADQPKPSYNNWTGGFAFGGPLKIPHLMPRGPNFYISYQRTQNKTSNSPAALVPTAAQRAGDLSTLTAALGQTVYIPANIATVSPACNTYLLGTGLTQGAINSGNSKFAGNIIPAACISNTAAALLNLYPLPNVAGNVVYNYQIPLTSSTHEDTVRAQAQRAIGNKNNVTGNITWDSSRSSNPSLFGFVDPSSSLGINVNGNWYHRFTQRLSMSTSYGFSLSHSDLTPFFANRVDVEGLTNINGVDPSPVNWGPPSLNLTSVAGLSDGISRHNRNESNSINVDFSWNRFRHNVRVGGDFRRQQYNYLSQTNPRGTFTFTGTATKGSGTAGSDLADLLLGIPDTSAIAFGNADKYLRQSVYDGYINDDFRVNPELSITAGLRWEYGAPVTEVKNRLVNLDIAPGYTASAPVLASNPTGSVTGQTYPTSLVRPDRLGITPRLGIAWRPISGSSLLVRAGYGIYNDTSVYQQTALAMAQQSPLSKSLGLNNVNCALTLQPGLQRLPLDHPEHIRGGSQLPRRLCAGLATFRSARSACLAADDRHLLRHQGYARRAGIPAQLVPHRC